MEGFTFQILTRPSRPPVAMRWYDLPHEGAHATEVIANGVGCSASVWPGVTEGSVEGVLFCAAGDGSSTRMVAGLREGESWIICDRLTLIRDKRAGVTP